MRVALLDINVLLALAWLNHQHHGSAHRWFKSEGQNGWATCAWTEVGFVRLSANRAFTRDAVLPAEAADLLRDWKKHGKHEFWMSPPGDDADVFRNALGHQQVMDAWLVRVAEENDGKFVTFDRGVEAHAREKGRVEVLAGPQPVEVC